MRILDQPENAAEQIQIVDVRRRCLLLALIVSPDRRCSARTGQCENFPRHRCIPTGISGVVTSQKRVNRQAVLIFADPSGFDLARRRLPRFLRPLFSWRRLQPAPLDADFHLFTSGELKTPAGVQCHAQQGATFAERLEAAVAKLSAFGYSEIVIVGSDCPSLTTADVATAFASLSTKRLVLGPDHRGGCYLIGLRADDRALLRDVQWNRNRDYDQLQRRIPGEALHSLAVKMDIDSWADVQLLARAGDRLAELCVRLSSTARTIYRCFVDLSAHAWRVLGQRPPPAFAA